MKYLLGIDLGTTNVKAILFQPDGAAVASGSAAYETYFPGPNMAEQDADAWWTATKDALGQILSAFDVRKNGEIAAMSVSSQAPSLLAVDAGGNPLRRAPIWMDRRADAWYKAVVEVVGTEKFSAMVGSRPDSFYLVSKLGWFRENEPELYRKTRAVLQANGWINYKLTGEFSIDVTHGMMTHCMDMRTLDWSPEIADAAGFDFYRILPPLRKNMDIIGCTTRAQEAETGLPAGIPVLAGTTDTLASMLALGICRPGDAAEVTGTSTLVYTALGGMPKGPGDLSVRPTPLGSAPYLLVGPASTTGASLKWFDVNFGQPEQAEEKRTGVGRYQLLDALAETAPAGSGGLLYFPYMMGERAPLWNTHAKGMFIGLTLATGRAEMVRAILEGTSFAVRHILDCAKAQGAQIRHIRSSGGGAKSDIWLKIKASMLKMPIHVPDAKTGDVPFGDALMAGAAVGIYPDLAAAAAELVQIKRTVEPVPEWTGVYDALYELYIDMYRRLDGDLIRLQKTVGGIK